MILPKKPQILYAPMLATFGGGSARGFGATIPTGGPPEFQQTGMVYQASPQEIVRVDGSAGISGNNAAVTNNNFQLQSAFPAQIMDVAWSIDDTSVHRIVARQFGGDDIMTLPLDFGSGTGPVVTSDSDLQNVRALMMLRNGVFVTFCTGRNECKTWKMNTDGTFTNYASTVLNSAFDGIQCIINPGDDGASVGDDTYIFIAGHAGNRFECVKIGGNGSITRKLAYTNQGSNGSQQILSPMKSGNADKFRFMVFSYGQNTIVVDYIISTNSWQLISSQSGPSASSYGAPMCATPSWGGFTYVGYERSSGAPIVKFYQNGTLQGATFNSTYTGTHNSAILAVEDGTSSSGVNGHVYWGCYNQGSSPERRLVAVDDKDGTGFSNFEYTNEILQNGSGHTSGGAIIGERPRYAEHDAKLESTHW